MRLFSNILDFRAKPVGFRNPDAIQALTASAISASSYLFNNKECSNEKACPVSMTVVKPQYLQVAKSSPGSNSTGPPQWEHAMLWAMTTFLILQLFPFHYFPCYNYSGSRSLDQPAG